MRRTALLAALGVLSVWALARAQSPALPPVTPRVLPIVPDTVDLCLDVAVIPPGSPTLTRGDTLYIPLALPVEKRHLCASNPEAMRGMHPTTGPARSPKAWRKA